MKFLIVCALIVASVIVADAQFSLFKNNNPHIEMLSTMATPANYNISYVEQRLDNFDLQNTNRWNMVSWS